MKIVHPRHSGRVRRAEFVVEFFNKNKAFCIILSDNSGDRGIVKRPLPNCDFKPSSGIVGTTGKADLPKAAKLGTRILRLSPKVLDDVRRRTIAPFRDGGRQERRSVSKVPIKASFRDVQLPCQYLYSNRSDPRARQDLQRFLYPRASVHLLSRAGGRGGSLQSYRFASCNSCH